MERVIKDLNTGAQQGFHNDIVVIGIGQALRGDDGAGLEAVRCWQKRFPRTAASVRVEIIGSPGLELLDLLQGTCAAILVDALQASSPPGSIVRLAPEDLSSFSSSERSAHGWGLAETLQLGLVLHPVLANVKMILLGIVGSEFNLGAEINPRIRSVLDTVADRVEIELQVLLAQSLQKEPARP
jgi:hydrogenase maturation protease